MITTTAHAPAHNIFYCTTRLRTRARVTRIEGRKTATFYIYGYGAFSSLIEDVAAA